MAKPTFANAKTYKKEEKGPKPKEKVVVWVKKAANGKEYLSIKINDIDGKPLHLRAFARTKKEGDSPMMPDYIGFEKGAGDGGTNNPQ